jgi:hypothetical protein
MDASPALANSRQPRPVARRSFLKSLTDAACRLLLASFIPILAGLSSTHASAKDAPTYVTSGELLGRALEALFDEMGHQPKVAMVLVEPALITVLTQGTDQPHHMDEWTISRFKYLWFDSDSVSGPAPHQSDGVVPEAENSFFALADANVSQLEGIVGQAVEYARMEKPASVVSLRISRAISMSPRRAYGAVEWQIVLTTGEENATVLCDASGRITGGDLSGTIRARNPDLYTEDDFPADAVQSQLAGAIGDRPIVHVVSISRTGVDVRAEHPTSRNLLRDYSWDYSGVRESPAEIPNLLATPSGRFEPFALSEANLAAFPSIKLAARRAFESETALITSIVARKPTAALGEPAVRWRVEFQEPDGSRGHVDVDADGTVLETARPPAQSEK